MYLKHISVIGFKSFPDKVGFDFSPGVTCIVGPNGCGKSNVVDAFKWVLGEQSAKLLRGRQMTDMIFNGSAGRRSSGLAQVDLHFDNADRSLPIDYDEVVVTRKLYRSGESEYLINKEVVRLKDVRELFLDTGVGADTYSVIEQGRVESLLQASSQERRAIFEEAAGIAKYKVRKLEAQRKLERTQQNLLRVDDIIEEVRRRLRSVKLQAGKARSFQAYEARLKELRASFSLAEYHRLSEEVNRFRAEADAATDEVTAARAEIDRREAESIRLTTLSDELDAQRGAAERGLMQARSELATQRERIAAAQRRAEEQRGHLDHVEARIEQLEQDQEALRAELAQVQELATALQQETHEGDAAIRELSAKDQALARELTQLRALVEDEKAGIVDLVRRSTQLRNEVSALTSHQEALVDQRQRLGQRGAAVRRELEDLVAKKAAFESRLAEIENLIQAETAKLADRRAEAARTAAARSELVEALATCREERSGLRSRLHLLDDLHRKMEGVGAGVKALLEQKRDHPEDPGLSGIVGMVADLFETGSEHAPIIEAAIGERDQHLVVTNSAAFLAACRRLGPLPGRLTAVCLDRLPPLIHDPEFARKPGFVATAADLIRCPDSDHRRVAGHLLGKTIVVDTLENALAMARNDLAGHRFVTLAGELVEPNGSVAIGPPSSRAGLIVRKTERRQIAEQLERLEIHISTLENDLDRTATEAGYLDEVQQSLRTAIYEAHTAKVEATAGLENVGEAIRRLGEEQPLIAGEVAAIEQQIADAKQRTARNEESIGDLDRQSEACHQAVANYIRRIEVLAADRDETQQALTEARVAVGQLAAKRAATADTINNLRRDLRKGEEALTAEAREREDAQARITSSEEVIAKAGERLAELSVQTERLEADTLQLQRRREMVRAEGEQLAAAVKAKRSAVEQIEARLHEAQLHMQELVVRRDDLVARVGEELGLDLAKKYESYRPGDEDWEAVEAEIADLRGKIERLGNVNLDAIAEQAELEERDSFLTTQRDDLEESRRQLESLIRKLDAESIERFTRTFQEIRRNFNELFRKLFGGGKADIVLENPDDVLESGVEILARPPGKELQRISLMSGGEKAMTALALMMSIFQTRPAPFAILDEVDAALDEANNVRFNRIVGEFLDRSQFIIITHSKRTMNMADHLYGITMQEPGISTRVSVKFEQEQPADSSAVA